MRIRMILSGGKKIRLRIPMFIVLSRMSAYIIAEAARRRGVSVSHEQIGVFMKTVKEFRCVHGQWKLVEVQSSDGTYVEITL